MNLLAALLLKAKLYILLAPLAVTMTGAGMNQAVLYANGGKFPVMVNDGATAIERWHVGKDGYMDYIHCLMTDKTHLNLLADYLNFHTTIMSPGDVMIALGDWAAAYSFVVWGTVVALQLTRKEAT